MTLKMDAKGRRDDKEVLKKKNLPFDKYEERRAAKINIIILKGRSEVVTPKKVTFQG